MDMERLAKQIQAVEFDSVFRIGPDGSVIETWEHYAPDVFHDPTTDVEIMGEGWECFTGMTGQYSYNGAVMHPSEYVGRSIAQHLYNYAQDCRQHGGDVVFALAEVRDEDGSYPDGDPIGWAIAYRETVEGS